MARKKNTYKAEAPAPANPQPVVTEPSRKTAKAMRKAAAKKPASRNKSDKPIHPKAKITFRHNIVPPVLGFLMFAGVLGLLNAQWLVAQYRYRFVKTVPESSLTATAAVDPNAPAKLYIPKISLTAPMVTDEKSYEPGKVQLALRRGVVQYGGASADPGQKGNTVIVGHSSGQLWAPGDYKFVFTLLNKLANDDRIFIDFKGTRYIYRVSGTKVVPPTDLSVLQPTDQPQLTLITCTPVGTSKNRLVVVARQVSPKPETAAPATSGINAPVTGSAIPN
jgi:LPXTG-site transpeptidase (sortase) family protein